VGFCLVSEKKLGQKNGLMGWGPGPGQGGQKNAKTLVMFPPENAKPKTKKFFFDVNRKTCWIHRGFEQLSSSSGWLFMAKKWRANMLACAVVKGLMGILKICWSIPCLHPSWKVYTWIEICASLNHRK